MTSDPLSRTAIAAVDPTGMLDDVLAQPLQLPDALWRAQSANVPQPGPGRWTRRVRDGGLGNRR